VEFDVFPSYFVGVINNLYKVGWGDKVFLLEDGFMAEGEVNLSGLTKRVSRAIFKIAVYIVVYVSASAAAQYLFTDLFPKYNLNLQDYLTYVHLLLAVAFGYLIVNGIATFFYWTMRAKYDHATAAAVRNAVRIIGVGALAASIAGGTAGGAAGTALGGFIGMVIGFATQRVLGQAVAGLFVLVARPFKIGDRISVGGEEGVVEDVATLFTKIIKDDGTIALIPNNTVIGGKILIKPPKKK